jgi:hypothetical protein
VANLSADEVPRLDVGDGTWTAPPLTGDMAATTASVVVYKMIGMDNAVNGLYGTWLVRATPDSTGALYQGALAVPLRNIAIAATWVL